MPTNTPIEIFIVSTDQSRLDLSVVCEFLTHRSYWAKGRSKQVILKSIKNSLCFGLYHNNDTVGFARVITDYSTFAWILDLFILEEWRGMGLANKLMDSIITDPRLDGIIRWRLNTSDAHSLYEKHGFRKTQQPDTYMEKS